MKERDLFEKVLEESLKRDETEENETFDKIMARVNAGEIEQAAKNKSRKTTFYKRFTIITVTVAIIMIAIITPIFLFTITGRNGNGTEDNPHYSSNDLIKIDVGLDYDITELYKGNTDVSGFQKSGISIYQTDDEAKKVILLAIYYTGDDGFSSFFINIVLVENLEYLNEPDYDGLNKKFDISINGKNHEINYRESFEPYDPNYPQIISVNQRTKFKIDKITYYMQVDNIIFEEDDESNKLEEIVTQFLG